MKTQYKVLLGEFAFILLYFALFSGELYRSGWYIFKFYYPFGIFVGIILLLILSKMIFHWSKKTLWFNIFAFVVMLFFFSWIADIFIGGLLGRFYNLYNYDNLFQLPEYFLTE